MLKHYRLILKLPIIILIAAKRISQANTQFSNLNQQNIFKQDLIYVTNSA